MELPFKLPDHSQILLAGAGGGFDIYCAIPVAVELKEQGHKVHLANYSFTSLKALTSTSASFPCGELYKVTSQSKLEKGEYFPELHLCRWWQETFAEDISVWCYGGIGVKPLTDIFSYLQTHLNLDAIVVLDGGVDGLFIGNEYDLATPSMDAVSIIAASQLRKITKLYSFTAFGTEGAESSVRHADALLRISELTATGNFLGVSALTAQTAAGQALIELVEYVNRRMPAEKQSVITGSIVQALKGSFGFTSYSVKTQTSPVWISPLTSLYWFLNLDAVASAKPYRKEVLNTDKVMDVADAIERTRKRLGVLPKTDIPI